jgi:hypothetical protein
VSATISADRLGVATVQSLFICEEGLNEADQFAFQATFKDTAPSTFAWPFIEPHRSGRGAFKVSCHPGTENCAATGGWDDPDDEVPVTPTSFDSRQAPVALGFFPGDLRRAGRSSSRQRSS